MNFSKHVLNILFIFKIHQWSECLFVSLQSRRTKRTRVKKVSPGARSLSSLPRCLSLFRHGGKSSAQRKLRVVLSLPPRRLWKICCWLQWNDSLPCSCAVSGPQSENTGRVQCVESRTGRMCFMRSRCWINQHFAMFSWPGFHPPAFPAYSRWKPLWCVLAAAQNRWRQMWLCSTACNSLKPSECRN